MEEEIIWTSKMKSLRDEISECNNAGIYLCDLSDEDREDFVNYLQNKDIPTLLLYTDIEAFQYGDPYDGDYGVDEVELECVKYIKLDSSTKEFLDRIDKCDFVKPFERNNTENCSLEDVENGRYAKIVEKGIRIITHYTKRVATALKDFSEVGVILDKNSLAPKMMGEFFTRYSNFNSENTTSDNREIRFSKSKMRFEKDSKEYSVRKGSSGYVVFLELLTNGREFINYTELLENVKNDGHYRTKDEKIQDAEAYIHNSFRDRLGIDMKIIELDKEHEHIKLSPKFLETVVVEE